ncbi:MAG: hypothetical protein KF823_16415 [Xanthomonadales bacterium]|nr:hypothetical protein [Xanthomonadales bacterium]
MLAVLAALATLATSPAQAAQAGLDTLDADALRRIARDSERSDPVRARAAVDALLARAAPGDAAALAEARIQTARISHYEGDAPGAQGQLDHALDLLGEAGDPGLRGQALHFTAVVQSERGGDHGRGLLAGGQALALYAALDDPVAQGRVHNTLAQLHLRQHQPARARSHVNALRAFADGTGDPALAVAALLRRGDLRYEEGADPEPLFRQALARAVAAGEHAAAGEAAQRLSRQRSIHGDVEGARDHLRRARMHLQEAGQAGQLAVLTYNEATLAERAGDHADALALYRRTLAEATRPLPSPLRVYAWLAIERLAGDAEAAAAREAGYREAELLGQPVPLAFALSAHAAHALEQGDASQARSLLERAWADLPPAPGFEIERHLRRLDAWTALVAGDLLEAQARLAALDTLFAMREEGDIGGIAAAVRGAFEEIAAGHGDARTAFARTQLRGLGEAPAAPRRWPAWWPLPLLAGALALVALGAVRRHGQRTRRAEGQAA